VHTVVEDYGGLAYAVVPDETSNVSRRAAPSGVLGRRQQLRRPTVLTDDVGCYRGRLWLRQCYDLDTIAYVLALPPLRMAERFHRTVTARWATMTALR
jgi:hypothetical protein